MKRTVLALVVGMLMVPGVAAAAPILTFEGFAAAGNLVNVSPGAPYTESGFTLTPTNADSAVFDAAAATDFPGDTTDFFGFAENNLITLTGPSPFALNSLLLGRSTLAGGPTTDITVVGFLAAGGSISQTFGGLTTATLVALNWSGLSSVEFRATDDSAIDNISINAVPEPTSLLLLGTGVAGLAARIRRRRNQQA